MALAMQGAVEGTHMGHPDFRVRNRIFATLHSDDLFGMVALTPDQQQRFIGDDPNSFTPESGAWVEQAAHACDSRPRTEKPSTRL